MVVTFDGGVTCRRYIDTIGSPGFTFSQLRIVFRFIRKEPDSKKKERFFPLPAQSVRNDKIHRVSIIGQLFCYLALFVMISIVLGDAFLGFFGNYFLAEVLSLSFVAMVVYLFLHLVLFESISKFDSRVLHELAKRGLVETAGHDSR